MDRVILTNCGNVITLTGEIRWFQAGILQLPDKEKVLEMTPITLPRPSSVEHDRPISSDIVRMPELERLYKRRTALDDLIRELEIYQRTI
jgi:hypothetical protein